MSKSGGSILASLCRIKPHCVKNGKNEGCEIAVKGMNLICRPTLSKRYLPLRQQFGGTDLPITSTLSGGKNILEIFYEGRR